MESGKLFVEVEVDDILLLLVVEVVWGWFKEEQARMKRFFGNKRIGSDLVMRRSC